MGAMWALAGFVGWWQPGLAFLTQPVVASSKWLFTTTLTVTILTSTVAVCMRLGDKSGKRAHLKDKHRQAAHDLFAVSTDITGALMVMRYALSSYSVRQYWAVHHFANEAYQYLELAAIDLSMPRKAPAPMPPGANRTVDAKHRVRRLTRTSHQADPERRELIALAYSIHGDGPPTRLTDESHLRIASTLFDIADMAVDSILRRGDFPERAVGNLRTASSCLREASRMCKECGRPIVEGWTPYDEHQSRSEFPDLALWFPDA
jgi:hypothetical protein